ncbi:PREDICTED: protein ABHD11 isoform X1 [Crocodylus porosus]|uniref:protein ABHD11 isoform X1 n=1 Tax=Crocodylus porosus TaxID=8502 RepID=UPI00093FECCE|nr:PREDICTED: protein ABHD11 isoform X1 [Crocodylus porosus]XP_019402015.1 PREDICTED: protein ABHD11 isoform X1 [Crocodylus porosus]XP_019402016.1 PREDICTED: protein ABHD11 isoform X1 [Crocodylus porosus]XP_019402017.1 PREDICTED: protein ABHD11 isoform X1 [Crocodylus porosus]
MTYEAMSLDVQHLLSQLHISKCILIGHSMGGKTAMTLALQRAFSYWVWIGPWALLLCLKKAETDLVERLVSVDISPTPTGPVTSFPAYISAMKSMSLPRGIPRSTARRLAEDQLRSVVQVPAVRQFLLTNLVEVEGHYMWRLNLEAISHHLPDIMTFPAFQSYYPGPTLFLRGSKSPYVSDKDFSEIERLFPKAKIQCIAGADHWVHADRPQEFIAAICNFLLLP